MIVSPIIYFHRAVLFFLAYWCVPKWMYSACEAHSNKLDQIVWQLTVTTLSLPIYCCIQCYVFHTNIFQIDCKFTTNEWYSIEHWEVYFEKVSCEKLNAYIFVWPFYLFIHSIWRRSEKYIMCKRNEKQNKTPAVFIILEISTFLKFIDVQHQM